MPSLGDVYLDIPGWFDFPDVYQAQVDRLTDGAHVVEVGAYLGKSTAYLAGAIADSGKRITFHAIDTFQGVPGDIFPSEGASGEFTFPDQEALRGADGTLIEACRHHLTPVADYVELRQAESLAAAATYADGSLDFVFLDNDHTTEHLARELVVWWPKLKPGGILAGHDYDWKSVGTATSIWAQRVGRVVQKAGARCWQVQKPVPATSWVIPAGQRSCLVAVCCNERNVPRRTVDSLVRFGWGCRLTDAAKRHGFDKVDFFWSDKRVLVSDLRDDAAMVALEGGYTHLIFLDADMIWPPGTLDTLLSHHARGMVSGLYHLKSWPHWPVALRDPIFNPDDQVLDYAYDKAAPHTDLLRQEALIGMGCVIMPTEIFRRFERPWFKYQTNATGYSTLTEDVYFCQQAKALGCPIWLDPTIECRHVSQETISSAHFDRATYEMEMLASGQRLARRTPDEVPA